ncbi:MAG: HPr family phosphocarrier protein [Clostridia bacterium]|nr:HPr family phosphocarrier protein [Clostridia bacterium]
MKTSKIQLTSINDVKEFVTKISQFNCDIDLISGRYVVDAKSIMGIFSLDLSKPIDIEIHNDNYYDEFLEKMKEFIVE